MELKSCYKILQEYTWPAVGKMLMRGKTVSAKVMGSESCRRIWHPVWASCPFCYHENFPWVFPRHCDKSFLLCVPTLFWSELCWVLLKTDRAFDFLLSVPREKSAGFSQGNKTPGMEPREGKSIPQKPGCPQFIQCECDTTHGLQLSVCPQEWGKDTSQGPQVTGRTGQALPQWLKQSVCEGKESWSWRNKWFEMLFISLTPDSVALNSSHLQRFLFMS